MTWICLEFSTRCREITRRAGELDREIDALGAYSRGHPQQPQPADGLTAVAA